jgi:hypothetical protein
MLLLTQVIWTARPPVSSQSRLAACVQHQHKHASRGAAADPGGLERGVNV